MWEKAARPADKCRWRSRRPTSARSSRSGRIAGRRCSALDVPVRTGVEATAARCARSRRISRSSRPAPCRGRAPLETSRLDRRITVLHAWEVLARTRAHARGCARNDRRRRHGRHGNGRPLGARARRVHGARGARELAPGMARNNRMELIERVASPMGSRSSENELRDRVQNSRRSTGGSHRRCRHQANCRWAMCWSSPPVRNRSWMSWQRCKTPVCPSPSIGDAQTPGDFLSCLRDASMTALSVDRRLRGSISAGHARGGAHGALRADSPESSFCGPE